MSLLGILILLIVACIILWGARAIMSAFGIGDPIATVVFVVLVIIILLMILNQLGMMPNLRLN